MKIKSKGVILAKIEAGGYGVDPTPVAGTDAIRVEDPNIEPITRKIVRNYLQPYMGARKQVNIGEGLKITFKTELKGSGTAGTPPEVDPLFRACNYTVTNVVATSDTYAPNSLLDTGESITIYFYLDALLHAAVGCRGTWSIEKKAADIAYISWEFTGIFAAPSDSANPSPTLNTTVPPRYLSAAFTLDSYAAVFENLKIEAGNSIGKRPSANAATGILEYYINGRESKGSFDPEVPTLATKNYWTMFTASSEVAMTSKLGSSAGNICTITAPKVQLDSIKYADREGALTHDLPLIFTPDTGNDELSIAFT